MFRAKYLVIVALVGTLSAGCGASTSETAAATTTAKITVPTTQYQGHVWPVTTTTEAPTTTEKVTTTTKPSPSTVTAQQLCSMDAKVANDVFQAVQPEAKRMALKDEIQQLCPAQLDAMINAMAGITDDTAAPTAIVAENPDNGTVSDELCNESANQAAIDFSMIGSSVDKVRVLSEMHDICWTQWATLTMVLSDRGELP